jgi:hypothetical protein
MKQFALRLKRVNPHTLYKYLKHIPNTLTHKISCMLFQIISFNFLSTILTVPDMYDVNYIRICQQPVVLLHIHLLLDLSSSPS